MRTDSEVLHQYRTQRHHDHEIENMAELNTSQRQQEKSFAAWGKRNGHQGALQGETF
jgi:hypothetical protein